MSAVGSPISRRGRDMKVNNLPLLFVEIGKDILAACNLKLAEKDEAIALLESHLQQRDIEEGIRNQNLIDEIESQRQKIEDMDDQFKISNMERESYYKGVIDDIKYSSALCLDQQRLLNEDLRMKFMLISDKFSKKEAALQVVSAAKHNLSVENMDLKTKVDSLSISLRTAQTDRNQYLEEVHQLKHSHAELANDLAIKTEQAKQEKAERIKTSNNLEISRQKASKLQDRFDYVNARHEELKKEFSEKTISFNDNIKAYEARNKSLLTRFKDTAVLARKLQDLFVKAKSEMALYAKTQEEISIMREEMGRMSQCISTLVETVRLTEEKSDMLQDLAVDLQHEIASLERDKTLERQLLPLLHGRNLNFKRMSIFEAI